MALTPLPKAFCLFALSACLVHAQDAAPAAPTQAAARPGSMGRIIDQLNSYLKLTPEQMQQIKIILQDQGKDLAAALFSCFTNKSLTKEDKAAKFKAVQTTCDTRIRSILSPDQQTKYDFFHKHPAGIAGAAPGP